MRTGDLDFHWSLFNDYQSSLQRMIKMIADTPGLTRDDFEYLVKKYKVPLNSEDDRTNCIEEKDVLVAALVSRASYGTDKVVNPDIVDSIMGRGFVPKDRHWERVCREATSDGATTIDAVSTDTDAMAGRAALRVMLRYTRPTPEEVESVKAVNKTMMYPMLLSAMEEAE